VPIPILRKDVFPFTCINPTCKKEYDVEGFIDAVNLRGLIYADCDDTIYQGITCECKKPNLLSMPRSKPIVDLRGFIITPNPNLINLFEQVEESERTETDHDFLRFKFIPAWDDKTVSYDEILRSYNNWHVNFPPIGIPYKTTLENFQARLNKEYATGEIQLRRLYPDIPKFRNLLTCLSPNWITGFDFEDGNGARAEGDTPREIQWRNNAWAGLLEEVAGKSLKETVIECLQARGISDFNKDLIDDEIYGKLYYMKYDPADRLRELSYEVGFEVKVLDYVKDKLNPFLYPVCTKVALDGKRKELLGWAKRIKKGKVLFVDAPMGLGKTYAIVEALAENLEMSAVIFMPTIRLCEEIKSRLNGSIVLHKIRRKTERNEQLEPFFQSAFRKDEYGNDEVYYAEGINENECPHFYEIVERYRENWIKKNDICLKCKNYASCRFISQWKRATLSRIVITTHRQYDRFYNQENIRKWYKHGYDNEDKAENRDVFIIDEDLVLSLCYQPVSLNPLEVKAFVSTVSKFLEDYENTEDIRKNIHSFFGQIVECDKTAIISPIDPEFKFPRKVVDEWEGSFYVQPSIIPETLDWSGIVGNHLDVVKNAIRLGAVVERWGNRFQIHLPNPKSYDLSGLPPHIFFDGTMLDNKFLEKKLQNVEFERMRIDVKSPWKLQVFQNVNTDLPKRWIAENEPNVKKFVRELINELGMNHKYFFITTKTVRDEYLYDFLQLEYPNLKRVIVHYGSLRGINEASGCDIGIMIGSCLISDTVEIAMALEFIQDNLPKQEPIPTENNLWTWKGSKGQRVYKDEYAIVDEMAKAFRLNEHRQAIARTRYLFHDVDFYVLSKDPVDEYEPYATVKDDQYRSDIFPPRKKRADADINYEKAIEAMHDWLSTHETVVAMEIHRNYDIGRHSASNYLKRMHKEGRLVKEGKTKYKYPPKLKTYRMRYRS